MWLNRLHNLLDSPLGAMLGGAVYGVWAFGVNHHAGADNAVWIGLSHWGLSSALTFFGVRIMRLGYRLGPSLRWRFGLSFLSSMLFSYALLIGLHLALATPQILLTLAPGFLPTVGFAVGYSLLLYREESLQQPQQCPQQQFNARRQTQGLLQSGTQSTTVKAAQRRVQQVPQKIKGLAA